MIRKTWDRDKWLLTLQSEHARIAAVIAAAWNIDGAKPHEETLLAISHHNDGWKQADAAPKVNDNGEPMDYNEIGSFEHMPIWAEASAALFEEKKYYAASLVAGHFAHLARTNIDLGKLRARQAVEVGRFIGDQQVLISRCNKLNSSKNIHDAAITLEDANSQIAGHKKVQDYEKDLRLLGICDFLALLLCTDFQGETEIDNVPYLPGADRLTVSRGSGKLVLNISPLPFRKNLREMISGIVIPRKEYTNSKELQKTISGTKPLMVEAHLGCGVEGSTTRF